MVYGLRQVDLTSSGSAPAVPCVPPSVRPTAGGAVRLAQASKKCKLYLNHPCTGARARLTAGGLRRTSDSEEAKMAELHYMEMGWSGSGWIVLRGM